VEQIDRAVTVCLQAFPPSRIGHTDHGVSMMLYDRVGLEIRYSVIEDSTPRADGVLQNLWLLARQANSEEKEAVCFRERRMNIVCRRRISTITSSTIR